MKEMLSALDICLLRFEENYAHTGAEKVIALEVLDELFGLALSERRETIAAMPKNQAVKVGFRAAYILETIYFFYPVHFAPYTDRFFNGFAHTTNSSAHRHFSKIMYHLLKSGARPADKTTTEQIAEACAQWTVDPKSKVAVQIWCIEILLLLQPEIDWVKQIVTDLLESLQRTPTPAIRSRMRRWQKLR